MWCLETIIALNQKICDYSNENKSIVEAYKDLGIKLANWNVSISECQIDKKESVENSQKAQ